MKKLALKLDDLKVDAFTTVRQPGGRGTVAGHYGTNHTQPVEGSCAGFTCGDYTCAGFMTMGPQGHCVDC